MPSPATPPDGRRLRWAGHRAQRRAAFVAAGAEAVDRYGSPASAEQIAAVAGVSRTVLYRYFRDGEDLRQSIAEHVVQDVLHRVLPMIAVGPASTPRAVISDAVGVVVGWLAEHPNRYHFLRTRRSGSSLDSVESTLADSVAALLTLLLDRFGAGTVPVEPSAYGIVGFVEAAGGWWLANRTMSRERFRDLVSVGVWHLLEGTARDYGIALGYDEPLPLGALAHGGAT